MPATPGPIKSLLNRLQHSRSTPVSSLARSVASGVEALSEYLPRRLRSGGEQDDVLSTIELGRIYAQLPAEERRLISDSVRVAASDSPTTSDGLVPRSANPTHRARGRLVFEDDGPDGRPRPLHNVLVELWDRDFGFDDILGRGTTDKNGEFDIWYDPTDAGMLDTADLELRIYDTDHIFKKGAVHRSQSLVYSIPGDRDVRQPVYDFGQRRVPFWEYDETRSTPRLMVVDYGSPPESFSPGRALMMNKQLKWLVAVREKHRLQNLVDSSQPSLDEIQGDYPQNRTLELQETGAIDTRGDEYFGQRLLNGMAAAVLDKDPADPGRYWIHHHWNSYQQNGEYAAPNVDIFLEIRGGKLYPVEIGLQLRSPGATEPDAPLQERQVFRHDGDPQQWLQAKRVARVSAALHAELDVHLAQTHLNVEQYSIAAHRNLRRSPLRQMLLPHLKEVVVINRDADKRLLGADGYISKAQALTAPELERRITQVMGTLDWKDWKPRPIYCEDHVYGKAAALYWRVLSGFVDGFFQEHREEIINAWYEVHRFSQDLVEHSVPMFLCEELRRRLLDESGRPRADTGWYEKNERMNLELPRVEANGVAKALSPVTRTDHPGDEDLENMKQLCRYVIFHATLFHTWVNSRQYEDGGELRYGGLGLRYGNHGPLAPEQDDSVAPPPMVASEQLWFAQVLSTTRFGLLMANEGRDVDPRLIEAVRQRRAAFEELGVNIYDIASRPNI